MSEEIIQQKVADNFMNEFKTYHPIVNFTYFTFVIGYSMFLMHPLSLAISLISGFMYSIVLSGKRAVKRNLAFMLPMLLIMALINPAFNHEGATILNYLPDGNPLTLESIIYGLCAAVMIASVICWFSCYNIIMTSDKFIYLFGKIIPSLSLILSMSLRFIPRFKAQLKIVSIAQRCIGRDASNGSIIQRAKHGLSILSIMVTWCLENSIDTADSMKSRGYGLPGRTAFSIYFFDKRDKKALILILLLGIYIMLGIFFDAMYFGYFPSIKGAEFTLYGCTVFGAYLFLCIYPIIIELKEVRKWKALRSKL